MENKSKKIPQKGIFDGFFGNKRFLHNSNVVKVYVKKWSRNWIFVARNPFFGLPSDVKITLKKAIKKKN